MIDIKGSDVLSEQDDAMHRLNLLEGELPAVGQSPARGFWMKVQQQLEDYNVGDIIYIDFKGEQHSIEIVGIARELVAQFTCTEWMFSQSLDKKPTEHCL